MEHMDHTTFFNHLKFQRTKFTSTGRWWLRRGQHGLVKSRPQSSSNQTKGLWRVCMHVTATWWYWSMIGWMMKFVIVINRTKISSPYWRTWCRQTAVVRGGTENRSIVTFLKTAEGHSTWCCGIVQRLWYSWLRTIKIRMPIAMISITLWWNPCCWAGSAATCMDAEYSQTASCSVKTIRTTALNERIVKRCSFRRRTSPGDEPTVEETILF